MAGIRIANVIGRGGRSMQSRFGATLEGGPELAGKLAQLDEAVRVRASKDAVLAASAVVAGEWHDRVPVLDGNYQRSLEGAERATKTRAGASGTVGPRAVPGLDDNDQPIAYAARLEYGDVDRAAEPSARPAFDAAQERAVVAAQGVLHQAVEGVAR